MFRQTHISSNVANNNGQLPMSKLSATKVSAPSVEDARLASLKVLALTMLSQVESLEAQIAANDVSELNLQQVVHRFEAAIIKSALAKTGGRQRRAARLLGVKVTTLNTKIKRHKLLVHEDNENSLPS
jgi:DNA-binding NtrC family response regulator